MKIQSTYIPGTEGYLNLFFRPAGQRFQRKGCDWEQTQEDDAYIVQWGGDVGWDSGYAADSFDTLDEAVARFEERANG